MDISAAATAGRSRPHCNLLIMWFFLQNLYLAPHRLLCIELCCIAPRRDFLSNGKWARDSMPGADSPHIAYGV
jgi:hypothetical protein